MPKPSAKHPTQVEFRSRFDEAAYDRLMDELSRTSKDLGPDDKTIHFFPLPDRLVKVTQNLSTHTAKVSYKDGRLGASDSFTEIEYEIPPASVDNAVAMFLALGLGDYYHAEDNRRHNFRLGEVEIALKWSGTWGYHAELEILLPPASDPAAISQAGDKIRATADDLGIKLMLRSELAAFERAFEARHRNKR